jgi:outer membrane immunogenic protein
MPTRHPVVFSQIKGGWTIGGGIEAQLAGNWTGKVEYLYLDLGTISGSAPNTSIGNVGVATFSSRVQDHIVRIGLNYHFSDPAVVAKY